MAELFQLLESNVPHQTEEAKQIFHTQFNLTKEPWILHGLYDFYLSNNSVPSIEILINIREPHHTYLFDKLAESIRGSKNDTKVQALTLLGHVVRKHPTWLYKITQHSLFKEILKLLKNETDILTLLSALLMLIVLLPCIPAFMKPFLQEVFEIFSRLAAWNCNNPGKLIEEQLVHMQVGLYALFQRLYGMYPCNFLTFLREHYRNKDTSPIFKHTIRPMLQTVQMHPLLVINHKDFETTTERWKKMEAQDVVMECERYSLDLKDRFAHDTCLAPSSYRSRSGTISSSTMESPYQYLKVMPAPGFTHEPEFFNPLQMIMHSQTPPITESPAIPLSHQGGGQGLVQSQEGTSPPEAAIEATPETTPIKDMRLTKQNPQHTSVARALNTFGAAAVRNRPADGGTTPTHSQPSSPMRKDASSFSFAADATALHTSAFGLHKRNSYATQKMQKLLQDRSQVGDGSLTSEIKRLPTLIPTSPLRIIPNNNNSADESLPSSPLPIVSHHHHHRLDSPISQEDEEVVAINRSGGDPQHVGLRQCDSVLRDVDGCRSNVDEEMEECEQGSPCTSGGLHMPNSRQMSDFHEKFKRLRYHSQCGPDGEQFDVSTGNSPRNSTVLTNIKRANSCPEMKKDAIVAAKDNLDKTLVENDEENINDGHDKGVNGYAVGSRKEFNTTETQTDNFWPMPYEHLFLSIFPSMENADVKPSPAPSPAPCNLSQDKNGPVSFNDILDRYVHVACQMNEKSGVKYMKEQLQLLHQQLLFEQHRRETHANRNRTLFTDVTKNKVLQEHNSALTDAVKLQEDNIDELKVEINIYRREKHVKEKAALDTANYWETKCKELDEKYRILSEKHDDLQNALSLEKTKVIELDNKWQTAEAMLLDANAEVAVAKEQVLAGERGRAELVLVNRELLLAGELILKYKERLADLSMQRKCDKEVTFLIEAYQHDNKSLQQQLESKATSLDACRTRIAELEQSLLQYDESYSVQKKVINEVKEECYEKLKVIESKYQTQLSINRSLEEKILELYQQFEMSGRRAIHSPDTSSCHEVNVTMTDRTSTAPGLSPHSSPLSASLASSEDSVALMNSDVKNLQMIADEKEPRLTRSSSTIESDLCQEASSSSAATTPSTSNAPTTSKTD